MECSMSNPFEVPPRTRTLEFLPGTAEEELRDLRAQLEEAIIREDSEDESPGPPQMLAGNPKKKPRESESLAEQIAALRDKWAGQSVRFVLREVPRDDWTDDTGNERPGLLSLLDRHAVVPGDAKDRAVLLAKERAMRRDLVFESLVEPHGTREQFDAARWSKPVWDTLELTAIDLSQELAALPKLSAASLLQALRETD